MSTFLTADANQREQLWRQAQDIQAAAYNIGYIIKAAQRVSYDELRDRLVYIRAVANVMEQRLAEFEKK